MDLSRVSVRMRPGALAPASARRWVHQIGPSWGVPLGLLEDAALVAGAMVLHSVRQAGSPLRLTLASSQAMVLIEVEDACTAFPTGYPAAGTRGPGCERLGMDLVKRVAQAYGYTRRPDGRQVWARVVDCAAAWIAAAPNGLGPETRSGPADRHLNTAPVLDAPRLVKR